uniref:Polymer-forming cytoskeletal protein n=1 Tax=Archaeoglobus fulgidus TaxID=2234 RepID=A0A7C3ZS27_ARCFL
MMRIDKKKMILSVKSGSVIIKNLRFDGTVVTGIDCSFLGSIEAREVNLGKGCVVGGVIRAEEVTVGAYSIFNEIEAEDVVILAGCRGNRISAKGDVRIAKNCKIGEIKGNRLLIEGNSKIGKMEARKIIAYG